MNRKWWILLLALLVCNILAVVLPVWMIYPFRSQTPRIIEFAYALRRFAPIDTILCTAGILFIVIKFWRSFLWRQKAFAAFALMLSFVVVWFSRQNHFEWMFNPMVSPAYAKAGQAQFLESDDMVLAVEIDHDAAAYPVRFLAYHHLVQDVVGGRPLVATY